jgi:thiol-disulfide isomerase/thioredoxin
VSERRKPMSAVAEDLAVGRRAGRPRDTSGCGAPSRCLPKLVPRRSLRCAAVSDEGVVVVVQVKSLSKAEAEKLKSAGKDTLVITYAPWCKFCQGMEAEMEKFAAQMGDKINIVKYRGDEDREFVQQSFEASGFPTITLVDKSGKVPSSSCSLPLALHALSLSLPVPRRRGCRGGEITARRCLLALAPGRCVCGRPERLDLNG